MLIAGRKIACGDQPWIVAEAGLSHNGSVQRALEMIDVAVGAGCDAIKFQCFKAAEFCKPDDPLFSTFEQCELPDSAWHHIKAECDNRGIIFFATPQNRSDLDLLLKVGIPAIKVGSDDLTNLALIVDYAREGLPIIFSCGMSNLKEVEAACISIGGAQPAVLVCTSEYPCSPGNTNLLRIKTFRDDWDYDAIPIGFSDHTIGSTAAIMSVAMGAAIIEKHFTLDHNLPGPDHKFSADTDELRQYVKDIRDAYVMLGSGEVKPSAAELVNKEKYQRKSGQQLRNG